jgi:hypothetical protein
LVLALLRSVRFNVMTSPFHVIRLAELVPCRSFSVVEAS